MKLTEQVAAASTTRTHRLSPALLPATLVRRLLRSNFLFLGHSLADWGMRVFVHRLCGADRMRADLWGQLDLETLLDGCVAVGDTLCLHALRGIDHEQSAVTSR